MTHSRRRTPPENASREEVRVWVEEFTQDMLDHPYDDDYSDVRIDPSELLTRDPSDRS
jgi:hypothetical protein